MIYMWFTGINYYKLAVEKDRDPIFTTIWKPDRNICITHTVTIQNSLQKPIKWIGIHIVLAIIGQC
jgi:hypothetical protein